MNIKSIFEAITPEHIRSLPIVNTAMNIFIKTIEENSEIASRIISIYDQQELETDSEKLKKSKKVLREGMYYTWIYTLYKCLEQTSQDKNILADLVKYKYDDAGLYQGSSYIINNEFIQANRTYSQKVGTQQALRYMYYFSKYLETGEYQNDLVIEEKAPFVMNYEGSVSKYMFRDMVKPLAHPIGWIDTYTRVITLIFQDYFGIELFTTLSRIELQNYQDWVVFIPDSNIEAVYEDFRKRINPDTHAPYTDDEIREHVQIITDKKVKDWAYVPNGTSKQDVVVFFTDDTVLYHFFTNPQKTIFTTYLDYINGFLDPIKVWDENWQFYSNLSNNYRFLYYDVINEFIKDIFITKIKENNGGKCDLSVYVSDYPQNCFKVGGQEYPYCPGSDEIQYFSKNRSDTVNEYNDKFTVNFNYKLFKASWLKFEDDYGHYEKWFFDEMQEGKISLNTFGFQGFNYKVTIDELVGDKYWFRCSGLNTFDSPLSLNKIFTENQILRINLGITLDTSNANNKERLEMVVTDFRGTQVLKTITESGNYEFEIPTSKLSNGQYRIDFYIKNPRNRIIRHDFYEGCDLKLYSDIEPSASFIHYKTKPNFRFDKKKISKMYQVEGWDSTCDYVQVPIGKLYDGSFSPRDELVTEYNNNGVWNEDGLVGKRLRGLTIEGSDFNKCYHWDLNEEETFIYYGFKHFTIDTSDFIITDSSKYVRDYFDISLISKNYYLYTEIDLTEDTHKKYLCSIDTCYLYTSEKRWTGI